MLGTAVSYHFPTFSQEKAERGQNIHSKEVLSWFEESWHPNMSREYGNKRWKATPGKRLLSLFSGIPHSSLHYMRLFRCLPTKRPNCWRIPPWASTVVIEDEQNHKPTAIERLESANIFRATARAVSEPETKQGTKSGASSSPGQADECRTTRATCRALERRNFDRYQDTPGGAFRCPFVCKNHPQRSEQGWREELVTSGPASL